MYGNETVTKNEMREIIKAIPKAEIHLHLEGLVSVDTLWKLIKKNNLSLPGIKTIADLKNRFKVKNLNDFIDLFINVIQNSFQSEEDILFLMDDARDYLKRNNIAYAEIFFAPSKFVRNGFSFPKMLEILDSGSNKIKKEENLEIKFLIDVSRTFGPENAMHNLDQTLLHYKESIIGIGLGGSEDKGPAQDYKKVFKKARKHGLHVVAHAGEDIGPDSIWHAIKDLKAERIGHGISAVQDDALIRYLKKTQIPLEICPKSNIFTGRYVSSYKNHPIRQFFDKGIKVTLNTDDPTVFGTELVDEYMNLMTENIFSFTELISILKNTIESTFLDENRKKELWKNVISSMPKVGER